ncbi:MAG: glycosyltransferase family 2 protein [Solirubrobacterales bacterium]
MASLSVVIVAFNSRQALASTLPALTGQLRAGDELIVVDNASDDGTPEEVARLATDAIVIETGENLGFSAAGNRGAEAATAELLCLLNPDAVPGPGWREAIELPYEDGRDWAAWQALVTAGGGQTINTRGGVVHFTGIAWAGDAGRRIDELPATESLAMEEPGFVSGACLAIPRHAFLEAGGFPDRFFLYHEDVDLSLRLRLAGGTLGVEPAARVDHDYEFEKGPSKWRYLERNRWATLIRTYPLALLILLWPALIATEIALIAVSARGGWFGQKFLAWIDTWRGLPRSLGERRAIQARRAVTAGEFAAVLTADLGSAYLGGAGRSRVLGALLRGYWAVVRKLLGSR